MKGVIVICLLGATLLALTIPVFAHNYSSWDEIRPCLKDGAGEEFVKPVGSEPAFSALTELDAVQKVVDEIAKKYKYASDTGEVWTSSDQMYERLAGDCEDWAILTVALLRFHTRYENGREITPDKVWVAVNLVTEKGTGVVAAHAWVGYICKNFSSFSFSFKNRARRTEKREEEWSPQRASSHPRA